MAKSAGRRGERGHGAGGTGAHRPGWSASGPTRWQLVDELAYIRRLATVEAATKYLISLERRTVGWDGKPLPARTRGQLEAAATARWDELRVLAPKVRRT